MSDKIYASPHKQEIYASPHKQEISSISDKATFTKKSAAGKGDVPRNISQKFRDNYEQINWHHGDVRPEYTFLEPLSKEGLAKEIEKQDNRIIMIRKLRKK